MTATSASMIPFGRRGLSAVSPLPPSSSLPAQREQSQQPSEKYELFLLKDVLDFETVTL